MTERNQLILTIADTPSLHITVCIVLSILSTGMLIQLRQRVQGTTLRAPVVWGIVVTVGLGMVEVWVVGGQVAEGPARLLRYIAAIATLCPPMALLGAKRPQDKGWQWIVATLWLVLALPALQSFLLATTSHVQLHAAWQGFLLLLIVIGVTNYLPTRFGPAGIIAGLGQIILLLPHLPLISAWAERPAALPLDLAHGSARTLGGLVCLAISVVWIRRGFPHHSNSAASSDWNTVWHDFRDLYGVVWALRVMERINQAARDQQCRLTWIGFVDESGQPTQPTSATLQTAIRTSLRRFVSPTWIDARCSGL